MCVCICVVSTRTWIKRTKEISKEFSSDLNIAETGLRLRLRVRVKVRVRLSVKDRRSGIEIKVFVLAHNSLILLDQPYS